MRTQIVLIFLFLTSPIFSQKQLLVYTKNGEGYVHDNIEASVEALIKLASENDYRLTVTEDPRFFTLENLKRFDCIIFSNTNSQVFYETSQQDAFKNFIQNGGGFVGIHSAAGTQPDWPWYVAMLGGQFLRHPALQEFKIKVIDTTHPATLFLVNPFKWEDECYFLNQLNPDIHILLSADLTTVNDPEKDKFPPSNFGNYTPLSWTHTYDGGRQFYTALGHKAEYYSNPLFIQHLLGGIKWVLKEE